MTNSSQSRATRTPLWAFRLTMLFLIIGICGGQITNLLGNNDFKFPDCESVLDGFQFQECHWRLEDDAEQQKYRLILSVDGEDVAFIELEPIDVTGIADFKGSQYQVGWGSYIEVAPEFQNRGIGERIWRLGDNFVKHKYGTGQVRIFVDALLNNPFFSQKIKGLTKPVFVSPDGADFVYIIE